MAEDFDIDSLAEYLHLTPEQVVKMANRDRLPGRRVGGTWRFSAAEIHHWLEERIGISDESELLKVEKVLEKQSANSKDEFALESSSVCDLLTVERICIPLNARTRNSVIEQLCEFAAETGALWLPKEMAEALRQREELHPTALENGVALLHPRRPQPGLFSEPFLALGITPSGIPYGGPRGCLTDIFFLIASSHDAFHLRILARLSRLIQLNGLLDRLRAASDAQQAFQAMIEAESQI